MSVDKSKQTAPRLIARKSSKLRGNLSMSMKESEELHSEMQATSSRLHQTNFSHHHEDCLCSDCTCGRHLCKMHVIKPDITKKTIYGQSFGPKSGAPLTILRPLSSDRHDMPHLGMGSTYNGSFPSPRPDSLERPKPKDGLGFNGPSSQLTSYSSGFPGHYGQNQNVRKQPDAFRGGLPFQGKTTYGKEFVSPNCAPEALLKTPDSMSLGKPWLGNSTYRDFYKHPNPEDYAARNRLREKLDKDPNYCHQYETTYKNDFLRNATSVCPAKILLETGRTQGSNKGKFLENSDYKAMSPQFQAFSRSRHVFV